MSPKERKVVQVACSETIVVLCDDGTVWQFFSWLNPKWDLLPRIPQPEETEKT